MIEQVALAAVLHQRPSCADHVWKWLSRPGVSKKVGDIGMAGREGIILQCEARRARSH